MLWQRGVSVNDGQFVDVYWQLVCVLINLLISKNWRSWWSLNVTIGQRSFRRGLQKTGKSKVINLHLFLIPESGLLSVGYVGFPAKHVSGFTTKWMYTVKVVFSDDSINQFKDQQVQYQQVQYVHRMSGVSLQEDCVIQHVKITCRSWCGVSWYWPFAHRSRPYEVQNNIEKASIPKLNDWASKRGFSGTGDLIFMHNGALATNVVLSWRFWRHMASNPHHDRITARIWILLKIYGASELRNAQENHHKQATQW